MIDVKGELNESLISEVSSLESREMEKRRGGRGASKRKEKREIEKGERFRETDKDR